jgi:cytochrome P450
MLASQPALWNDPFPYYEKMRERGPIYHARELKNQPYPHVVATGFDQVSAVFKHDCIESEAFIDDSRVPGVGPQCVLMQNPPRHDEVRRKLTKGFTARAVDRLEPLIVAQSDRLLDAIMVKGEFDVIEDYALPLTLGVIAEILGVPEEHREQFRALGPAIGRLLDPLLPPEVFEEVAHSSELMMDIFDEMFAERHQALTEDLLSVLVAAGDSDARVTTEEQRANAEFILVAGYETTVGMIGNGMNILLDRPDVWADLQSNPDLVPNAVEEILRTESPVQWTIRTSRAPFDVSGFHIPAQTRVVTVMAAGNRDPDVFPQPAEFDIRRENASRNLAFVVGPHYCLGASLARLEGRIAFRSMLERMPAIKRAAPASRRPNLVVRGLTNVPVAFTAR